MNIEFLVAFVYTIASLRASTKNRYHRAAFNLRLQEEKFSLTLKSILESLI